MPAGIKRPPQAGPATTWNARRHYPAYHPVSARTQVESVSLEKLQLALVYRTRIDTGLSVIEDSYCHTPVPAQKAVDPIGVEIAESEGNIPGLRTIGCIGPDTSDHKDEDRYGEEYVF